MSDSYMHLLQPQDNRPMFLVSRSRSRVSHLLFLSFSFLWQFAMTCFKYWRGYKHLYPLHLIIWRGRSPAVPPKSPPLPPITRKLCYRKDDRAMRPVVSVTGTFAPKNFRSRERKYHGMELSLPGAKVPRTFAPRNFRSREQFLELSLPGTFAPWNFRSWERKFQELSLPGTFIPWNYRSLSK